MSRAQVTALALVNWKGVFYERYLLDRHVTALEGANGAGKTTVMIAAYVVLLPDMTRLRFTNLGESGATGGDRGIWGRLGELGRPSYTALELDLAGERLVLGVCLTRTTEPTVEPTAFIVSGLAASVRLSEILLLRTDDGDHVPELAELKASVARVGGSIQVFRATKDYFAALFERGISPLRLTGEEERNKWNDMLRTSMTGGISRALGTELRSFLLREESGLSDTLSRMRDNLESCRRTRLEVFESRQLEREISAIYEAGLAMFSAALHAARLASIEARARVREAGEAIERVQQEQGVLAAEASQLAQQEVELTQRSADKRAEVTQLEAAKQRGVLAAQLEQRLSLLDAELRGIDEQVHTSAAIQRDKALEREVAKAERARALEAYDRASMGLANLQQGLAELARRAHAHSELSRCLAEARSLLDRPTLELDAVPAALLELADVRAAAEAERAALVRQGRDLQARRLEHAEALQALQQLSECALLGIPADGPEHTRARALLSRCADLEAGGARIAQLEQELHTAQRLRARQQVARELAVSLGLALAELSEPGAVPELLSQVEREQQTLEQQLHPDGAALDERQRLAGLRQQYAALDQRAACFRLADEAASRIEQGGVQVPRESQAALLGLRDKLVTEQLALAARRDATEAEREVMQAQAAELNRGGAVYAAELLRVRDELGAELLAARFEDLEPAQAAWVEARLGPWVDALVVDDTQSAIAALGKLSHGLGSVHLVGATQSLDVEAPAEVASDAVVLAPEAFGTRVTKQPLAPSLGRRAREAKLRELRVAIEEHTKSLEQLAAEVLRNAGHRRDADLLWTHAEIWLGPDPLQQKSALEQEIAELEQQQRGRQHAQQAARTQLIGLRSRAEALRRLLPEAQLLVPPDHAERARELETTLQTLTRARSELARLSEPRATLSRLIDVLRAPPPDDQELATQSARLTQLEAELDRVFRARSALEGVVSLRHAVDFGDAQAALDAQAELSPALEQQQKSARAQLQASEAAENLALAGWEAATESLQIAQAARSALTSQRERSAAELYELGGASDSRAIEDAELQLQAAQVELVRLAEASRACVAERTRAEERRARAEGELVAARARQRNYIAEADPLEQVWSQLRDDAESRGVLHGALSVAPAAHLGSVQLRSEADSKRELLLDRVARARGGDELATSIRGSESFLDSWQAVRAWLGRRVPSQIADVAEPLLALERLRDHLDVLEARLTRQEGDLRGSSEDVARGIDVQLRRAHGQVRRLNQQLEGIQFGSIQGIRIEMRRIERMEQILRALRDGQAQELLFSSSLPIEDALEEIFKRYGGGGKSGGQRLLDYREYVELAVEIRRRAAEGWEPANPTRLSTGEAIGVGAALMMVVLTEWERDANLLGPRDKLGSVRFLFLDEANRLSRDNLGVLFDLCRTLDLQLLVAAPEVARADGNTTYRLVRHTTPDGREEVIVSGRRAVPTASEAESEADHEPEAAAAAEQSAEPTEPEQLPLTAAVAEPTTGLLDFDAPEPEPGPGPEPEAL